MAGMFFLGGLVLTLACPELGERSIWIALIPLMPGFILLSDADRNSEYGRLEQKPHGH